MIVILFFFWGPHQTVHRDYSWLCTQELFLAMFSEPYGMPGIEPKPGAWQANILSVVLLPQPLAMSITTIATKGQSKVQEA